MLAQPRPPPQQSMAFNAGRNQYMDAQAGTWTQEVPLQRPYARSVGAYSGGLTYAQHELLRQRKTPSGRQYETLDIANIDENLQLPAPKHLLLSLSPNGDNDGPTNFGGRQQQAQDGYPRQTTGATAWMNSLPPRTNVGQFEPAWSFPGGYDSITRQIPPLSHSQRPFYNPRSQVPTVMPAILQPSFVPTASAGQQYYGPYWPDGTFSPYRPAPVRDDRFFHWRQSRDMSRYSGSSFANSDRSMQQQSYDNISQHAQQVYPTTVQGVRGLQSLPPRDAQAPYPSFHDRITGTLDRSNFHHELPYQAAQYGSQIDDLPPAYLDYHQLPPLQPTPASERLANRERTFTWAYRVYIELLAQIQRDSKHNRQHPGASGPGRPAGKPAIFPRPPQRSISHFSESCVSRVERYSPKHPQNGDTLRDLGTESRPTTAIRLPRRASDYGVTPSHAQHHNRGTHPVISTGINNFAARSQPPTFDPSTLQFYNAQDTFQSTTNATAALEAIERLCTETEVTWLDGMLLAGCLAYGIGKYDKALRWYQKVLNQESGHVEAMSNLAATLLALGKQEEAAGTWQATIKLRPSYFEAVEHLVGLFVSTQRTRDAVEIIEYIESCLKLPTHGIHSTESGLEDDSDSNSRASSTTISLDDAPYYDFEADRRWSKSSTASEKLQGFGQFGYALPAADNGRLLALIHAKGNMLYGLGNNRGAAAAFEDAILIATGERRIGVKGLIDSILRSCISTVDPFTAAKLAETKEPILLSPDRAQQIAQRLFPPSGDLPGLEFVPTRIAHRAAISTTSNSLLSLAKIYQDGLGSQSQGCNNAGPGTREILALYYLSLSLQPSPSTANNVGILLASVQSTSTIQVLPQQTQNRVFNYTGVVPGSGVALALAYYNYGLNLDGKHAHLYTNLGSLLKDLGELQAATRMYETAVSCDGNFDIALANLANAVKDQGRIADAIKYYKRAVQANPDFAEAVCGLATALNSVCDWYGRGGVYADNGLRDKIHVDENGMMHEARKGSGWMNKVVEIVDKQLRDGANWGLGVLTPEVIEIMCRQLTGIKSDSSRDRQTQIYRMFQQGLQSWAGRKWEGTRLVRLVERAVKRIGWQWYQDRHVHGKEYPPRRYARPLLPGTISVPSAPTVLPFHTFTTPLSSKQVRQISQRNALRISVSTLKSAWLPSVVYPPPVPPNPCLNVGYVSSDFNNHPLAHLMQSIFGLHDPKLVCAHCYATTPSDSSIHRAQIEREAPVFHDASSWPAERLVSQIVYDGIHILVNLNGYTRGARNEVFAARPAPIHMSFMGFAGTLGAEWCDYVYADEVSIPTKTLAPFRQDLTLEDKFDARSLTEDDESWTYAENVIFSSTSFFCVDHKQSAPDAQCGPPPLHDPVLRENAWQAEQARRWQLRRQLFPTLPDSTVILGNFNQLYKIDPATFRMYLRILSAVPNAILWLLRFPDLGERNLLSFARLWAGEEVAKRIIFTDVAPKGAHILRASVVDLFLDTPECNAHTTAADVIWSGTPVVTWGRWGGKMCSRMAGSIVGAALPEGPVGDEARGELLVGSEREYEVCAVRLARGLVYEEVGRDITAGMGAGVSADRDERAGVTGQRPVEGEEQVNRQGQGKGKGKGTGTGTGKGRGRLMDLRRLLWEGRWTSRLFDTKRWVREVEQAYWRAWEKWERGEGGDIWL